MKDFDPELYLLQNLAEFLIWVSQIFIQEAALL